MGAPGPPWVTLFNNLALQGNNFNAPISRSGRYFAFLAMAELNESTEGELANTYELTFELLPAEWMENVYWKNPIMSMSPPAGPATFFQVVQIPTDVILKTLGLTSTDDLASGSWYYLELQLGETGMFGEMWPSNYDVYQKEE